MNKKNKLIFVIAVTALIAAGCTVGNNVQTETISNITSETTSVQTEATTENEAEQEKINMEKFKDIIVEEDPLE